MDDLRKAAQAALDALTNCEPGNPYGHRCNRCDSEIDPDGTIANNLRAALAQPKPASNTHFPLTAELVAAALLLKRWAEARNEPAGWHIVGIGAVQVAQPEQQADTVPWPKVVSYAGGGAPACAWVDVQFGDGPEVTRFVKAKTQQQDKLSITKEQWDNACNGLGTQGR